MRERFNDPLHDEKTLRAISSYYNYYITTGVILYIYSGILVILHYMSYAFSR